YRPIYRNQKPLERTQNWIKLGGKVRRSRAQAVSARTEHNSPSNKGKHAGNLGAPVGPKFTANVAKVAPTAMIFVPCRDGVSHNVKEYASPEDLAAGTNVLLHALLKLAQ
ncbi:M20/M25/M40 family metallo-hydrolase, partial [Pseudaminobacter sp. 19-2017]